MASYSYRAHAIEPENRTQYIMLTKQAPCTVGHSEAVFRDFQCVSFSCAIWIQKTQIAICIYGFSHSEHIHFGTSLKLAF